MKFLPNTQKKTKKPSSLDQRDDSFSFGGQGYQSSSFQDSFEPQTTNSIRDQFLEKKFSNTLDYIEEDFFKDVKLPPTSLPSSISSNEKKNKINQKLKI